MEKSTIRHLTTRDAIQFETAIEAALTACDFDQAQALVQEYQTAAGPETRDGDPGHAPWFRARYLAARVALDAGWLEQALEGIQRLLPLTTRLPPETSCRVWVYAAEA